MFTWRLSVATWRLSVARWAVAAGARARRSASARTVCAASSPSSLARTPASRFLKPRSAEVAVRRQVARRPSQDRVSLPVVAMPHAGEAALGVWLGKGHRRRRLRGSVREALGEVEPLSQHSTIEAARSDPLVRDKNRPPEAQHSGGR
jgi:hypothetical protein